MPFLLSVLSFVPCPLLRPMGLVRNRGACASPFVAAKPLHKKHLTPPSTSRSSSLLVSISLWHLFLHSVFCHGPNQLRIPRSTASVCHSCRLFPFFFCRNLCAFWPKSWQPILPDALLLSPLCRKTTIRAYAAKTTPLAYAPLAHKKEKPNGFSFSIFSLGISPGFCSVFRAARRLRPPEVSSSETRCAHGIRAPAPRVPVAAKTGLQTCATVHKWH